MAVALVAEQEEVYGYQPRCCCFIEPFFCSNGDDLCQKNRRLR